MNLLFPPCQAPSCVVRRSWCVFAVGLALAAAGWSHAADATFNFDTLRAEARELAARPYVPPKPVVPQWLRDLSYDDLRRIEFGGAESLWHREKLPFEVQYLHPGFIYDKTVQLFEVQAGRAHPIPFRREYFNYQGMKLGPLPPEMGFAGFRLMYPIAGTGTPLAEVGAFAGASYFRFLSTGAAYGLSARGLALNTWEPEGEEFPLFTKFWFVRGDAQATQVNIFALLESESVTGAYQFTVAPGDRTVVDVKATLYCRKNAKVFGVAPLTSMFWHGENSTAANRDFRPEVHDSDGLLMLTGAGEWLWRPLENPPGVTVATFADENPRAFGLLQRDRDFENYQDLEASYHARPSLMIEPVGKWGKGSVRLIEIPTTTEFDDNIVAFWAPEKLPPPGQPIDVAYRMTWDLGRVPPPRGFVRATRHGKSARYEPGFERFVIDFDGPNLQATPADAKLEPVVTVGNGAKFNHASLQKNRINGTWRVAFTIRPDGSGHPVELRCFIRQGASSESETWSYLWQP
jgi:periplasmic glucans biosynthesis protein